jgi:hypothetical protein
MLNVSFLKVTDSARVQAWRRDGSVGIATDYRFDYRQGQGYLFSIASRPTLGRPQPPIQFVPGALSRGVRRPGREADHSPPSSAEVKNGAAIPPLLHVFMMA